jgi:hypothetical protein
MSGLSKLLAETVSLLNESGFCDNTQILETSSFSTQQFAFKIRAAIFSILNLQIRVYYNRGHYDYSYQIFDTQPICRWDNAEHFPELTTFPHHFHAIDGKVVESSLIGNPVDDLRYVLSDVRQLFGGLEKP